MIFYQLTSVYTDDILYISDIYNIQAGIYGLFGLEVGYGLRKCNRDQESYEEV